MPLAAAEASPPAAAPNFRRYAAVYDLLYRDKDYAAEADYVVRTLRVVVPGAHDLLELGCGSGRHGRLLAANGFAVHGIEHSPDMVLLAQSAPMQMPESAAGSFDCETGDIRNVDLRRRFDAAVALFHVVSYQATDADLDATFAAVARHLVPGGAFVFDVWHGPAVLAQRPERRVKTAGDERMEVIRTARPQLDAARRTVTVSYDIECRDRDSGEIARFSEDHLMRYLFPDEIATLAARAGLRVAASEEFMTGRRPSPATWSVLYVLRRPDQP